MFWYIWSLFLKYWGNGRDDTAIESEESATERVPPNNGIIKPPTNCGLHLPHPNADDNRAPFSVLKEIRADGLESIKGIGIITDIARSYCRINGLYHFDASSVVASTSVSAPKGISIFNRGDKVEFKAKKRSNEHSWYVTFVKRFESKLVQINEEECEFSMKLAKVRTVNRQYVQVQIRHHPDIALLITIPRSIVQSLSDMDWIAGDWMRIDVGYIGRGFDFSDRDFCLAINEERIKIRNIDITELEHRQGKITKCLSMLFIDNDIYFPSHVGEPDVNYSEGTLVNCTYIPSNDTNLSVTWNFRAISVEVVEKDTKKLSEIPMVVHEPETNGGCVEGIE